MSKGQACSSQQDRLLLRGGTGPVSFRMTGICVKSSVSSSLLVSQPWTLLVLVGPSVNEKAVQ